LMWRPSQKTSSARSCPLPGGECLSFALKAHDRERAPAAGGWVRGTMLQRTRSSGKLTPPSPGRLFAAPALSLQGRGLTAPPNASDWMRSVLALPARFTCLAIRQKT
jgi:hypothetical protein